MRKGSPVICRNFPCNFLGCASVGAIEGGGSCTEGVMSAMGSWSIAGIIGAIEGGGVSGAGAGAGTVAGACACAGAAVTPWHICDSDRPAANSMALAAIV